MIRTCDKCAYQSNVESDFYVTFVGGLECVRCHCKPLDGFLGKYYEPKEFTKRYQKWKISLVNQQSERPLRQK